MRIPYIVGRWVRDREHYGRQRLIEYILTAAEPAIWVVGTRRMGKTSLLRQLEWETAHASSVEVPLFWDLQGCESFDDLSYEIFLALEDVAERFLPLGVDIDRLEGQDVLSILRTLNRTLEAHNKRLLLLIDEAEVLIHIGRHESKWLARLRKAFQNGRQRTVISSTKLLAELNDVGAEWNTSPFLFGFSPANLWSLSPDAAVALVTQQQSETSIRVDDATLEDIVIHTNRHPYLMQFLCQRLFEADGEGARLRAVEEHDLAPDHLLAGFFQIDFQHLSRLERRILLTVTRLTIASEEEIITELCDEAPERIHMFIYGLDKLGYLRRPYGQITVGNEFLRRWLQENYDQLSHSLDSTLDEKLVETMLHLGQQNELSYLHAEIGRLQGVLNSLQQPPAVAAHDVRQLHAPPPEIQQIYGQLQAAQRELERLPRRRMATANGVTTMA